MSAPRLDSDLVRKHILDTLAAAESELTTAAIRQLLLSWAPRLINEIVYRNLVILEQRGQVRRLRLPGRRHVAWALNTTKPEPATVTEGQRR